MTDTLEFEKVAVLGAGTMGAGIAQVCAAAGATVRLYDVQEDALRRGFDGIERFLRKGVEKGKTSAEDEQRILAAIQPTGELGVAVREAQIVIEAAPEDLQLKRKLFEDVADLCDEHTVLATNTSSLALGDVFGGVPGPQRCLGTHFFNPPPLMPLLEVVRTSRTGDALLSKVLRWAKQLGKDPIVVRDSPGFATSRLGVVLGLEAIRMLEEEVASPQDIDKAMELGYRHPMGPLKLTDLVGLDVRMAIADYLRSKLQNPAFEVPKLMREMVARGELGKKSGKGFYGW